MTEFSNLCDQSSLSLDFFNYSLDSLSELLRERFGETRYRAIQLFEWVYKKNVTDVSQMTNISKELREEFSRLFYFPQASIKKREISSDGSRKYLFEFASGNTVESVMIKQPNRMTLCVSSQVGCGMGCTFCRTGTMGFIKNLSSSEIVQQVLAVIKDAQNFGDIFHNIVFMGMGEPLHNFNGITEALRILTAHHGLAIGGRKITVSTVGLVPAIKKFGDLNLDVNLAVSLNATTNEVRSKIMPINKNFPLEELINTLRAYPLKKRRQITIEYVLLKGINDTRDDMVRLRNLLQGIRAKVNLIPYNQNAGLGFVTPPKSWIQKWQDYLVNHGIYASVRWSKGGDVSAACGQLATEVVRLAV